MNTYNIWTTGGAIVATVKGTSVDYSKDGFIYVLAEGGRKVAIVPAEGFAIILDGEQE